MATKVNVMKLLQEVRGFAQITSRRPLTRPMGPLLLQYRPRGLKHKRFLRILVQDPPDIPHPVPITYLPAGTTPPSAE